MSPTGEKEDLLNPSPSSRAHVPAIESSTFSMDTSGTSGSVRTTDVPGDTKDVEKQDDPATKVASTDPSAFPDGGLEAWTVVLGGFCSLFVSFGWINCIGIFQTHYQTHQLSSYSPSVVAWIPSLETFMMYFLSTPCGRIYDNYGPKHLLVVGTFLHVFGIMMTSLATEYYQFILAQSIVSAAGAACIFYPSVNAISTWFYHRRAFAIGIVTSGSSVGGVIMPIMVERLIPRVGFGWAMRSCAFLILALCVVANLTIKSRIAPRKKPFRVRDFVAPLKEPTFALTTAAAMTFCFGLFLPFTFIILSARRFGMSARLAGYLVPILNAGSTLGRTLPGWVADRIGRFNTMIVMSGLSAILVLAFWIPARDNASIIVFTVLYGFSSGGFVSLPPALIAQISDVREIGTRTGTLLATAAIGILTGNPIGGALVPDVAHGDYWQMQLFAGLMMAVGTVLFLLARVNAVGWGLMKKF